MGHAFENTVILLDDERRGFDYPLVQFSVNWLAGRRVNAARGLRLPLAMRDEIRDPETQAFDPPGPNPHRCMQVGAAAARVMAQSPWRTAFVASSSWSHSFLTEKNWQLWPDVAADRALYDAPRNRRLRRLALATPTDQIEESGQHDVLNWFCLLGAMEELGRKPDKAYLHRELGLRLAGRIWPITRSERFTKIGVRRKPGPTLPAAQKQISGVPAFAGTPE